LAFKTYESYFAKKSQEFFGKKIYFSFSKIIAQTEGKNAVLQTEKTVQPNLPQKDQDPLVSAIIDELGGEEIK